MKVQIAHTNGNFTTLSGKELTIRPTPSLIIVMDKGVVIFAGSVSDIRYVKYKTN